MCSAKKTVSILQLYLCICAPDWCKWLQICKKLKKKLPNDWQWQFLNLISFAFKCNVFKFHHVYGLFVVVATAYTFNINDIALVFSDLLHQYYICIRTQTPKLFWNDKKTNMATTNIVWVPILHKFWWFFA